MAASPRTRTIVDLVTFHFSWIGIVWGAAERQWAVVALSFVVHLLLHLGLSPRVSRDATFALVAGLAGWLLDSLLGLVGVFRFPSLLAPAWLLLLWLVFSATIETGFGWFRTRLGLAAVLGLVSGPFSYEVGVKLGALQWGVTPWIGWLVLALVWAAFLPAMLVARSRWDARYA